MATDADVMAEMKRQFEWASRELANKEQENAALVAQRDRLRASVRYLSTAYNGEYGDGASTDEVIEATVPPLQPGDLGEGGAE